jgi:hypothetical protein
MSNQIDELKFLINTVEKITHFGKVCIGPGCPFCDAEDDLEPQHPATWEAKETQKALENSEVRSCNKKDLL